MSKVTIDHYNKEAAQGEWGHLPRTVSEALSIGSKKFFSGQPCGRGHYAPRFVLNSVCTSCHRENVAAARSNKKVGGVTSSISAVSRRTGSDAWWSLEEAMIAYSHLPKSKDDAIESGHTSFFSGEPCKHGHYAPRYVYNSSCTVCRREHLKKKREKIYDSKIKERRKEMEAVLNKIRRRIELGTDNSELATLLTAYLSASGATVVLPGVLQRVESVVVVDDWILGVIKKAMRARICFRDEKNGLLFIPSVLNENPPRSVAQAAYWRKVFSGLKETIMSATIGVMLTTVLMGDLDSDPREDKPVLRAWLGVDTLVGL